MDKKLIICVGCSGSGKTTMTKEILAEHFKLHNDMGISVSADHYWIRPDGVYDWNPKNIGLAHKWCQDKCKWYMQESYPLIIVDNTNLSKVEREPYVKLAEQFGYIVELREPSTEWRYNALECSKRNTHGVPLATLEKMLAKLTQDRASTLKESE